MGFLSSLFRGEDVASKKVEPTADSIDNASEISGTSSVVLCPVSGTAMDISEVNDPVFSSKAMGDGIAVVPSDGTVVAPISGTVEALFPTGHALAIKGDDGMGVMLHIGIDTVDMKGEGFHAFISQGDRIECGQKLVEFDRSKIAAAGYEDTTMVIVTESPFEGTLAKCAFGPISRGEEALCLVR